MGTHGELCELGGRLFSTAAHNGGDGLRAVAFYEQACDLGIGGACLRASRVYEYGGFAGFDSDNNLAVPADDERALALYNAGCQLWYGHDCAPADLDREESERGLGDEAQALPEDASRAMIAAANQCDEGDLTGCTRLGLLYLSGTRQGESGTPSDQAAPEFQNSGLRLLRTSCTEGSLISACPALAKHCAFNPDTCTEDVDVYRRQAQQNYPVRMPRFSVEPAPPMVLVATALIHDQTGGLPIRLAVWSNGHVIWSEDRQVGGPPLREGWLDPESVESVLDNLNRIGLFEDWDFVMGGSFPGDLPLTVVVIDDGARRLEVLSDYEWTPSHKNDRFAARWDELCGLLEELVPENGTLFEFDTLNRLRQEL